MEKVLEPCVHLEDARPTGFPRDPAPLVLRPSTPNSPPAGAPVKLSDNGVCCRQPPNSMAFRRGIETSQRWFGIAKNGYGHHGGWVDTRDFPATPRLRGVSAASPQQGPIAVTGPDKYGGRQSFGSSTTGGARRPPLLRPVLSVRDLLHPRTDLTRPRSWCSAPAPPWLQLPRGRGWRRRLRAVAFRA